ncbi:MAG TPA: superinfection immunity protein [Dehalococcoidia bacterium]|nr:superinfection immunity protein [Dehalococcoidia bacterium]
MKLPAILAAAAGIYLLPAELAYARRHRNRGALLMLNLLGGWTIVGWAIALIWALYRDPSSH